MRWISSFCCVGVDQPFCYVVRGHLHNLEEWASCLTVFCFRVESLVLTFTPIWVVMLPCRCTRFLLYVHTIVQTKEIRWPRLKITPSCAKVRKIGFCHVWKKGHCCNTILLFDSNISSARSSFTVEKLSHLFYSSVKKLDIK